jgi:hypothetical protein
MSPGTRLQGRRTDGDRGTGGGRDRVPVRRPGRAAPGGGSAASPSAARSRRTACGSVTAPRIRRAPPQRSQTSTWMASTRRSKRAQFSRLADCEPASALASSGAGRGTSQAEAVRSKESFPQWCLANGCEEAAKILEKDWARMMTSTASRRSTGAA